MLGMYSAITPGPISFESGNSYGSYVNLINEFRNAVQLAGNSKLLRSESGRLGYKSPV